MRVVGGRTSTTSPSPGIVHRHGIVRDNYEPDPPVLSTRHSFAAPSIGITRSGQSKR
ncbi:hypothetical protein BJX63DRAFT_413441 [Aspergillus granulosus]|uniref:Actin n=1 Tax=Aspergillus granulosus TaxID=176169 RepID=A0ABR4GV55_9EURO